MLLQNTKHGGNKMQFGAPFTISKGDRITIAAQGIKVTGTVLNADWYDPEGWYIEMNEANVPGGYSYWKQRYDGGKIVAINGKDI